MDFFIRRQRINLNLYIVVKIMKPMKPIIAFTFLAFINIISCNDNPVKPEIIENRKVVISSVVIFPEVVGPGDSLIVICNASDPDGDTLVYDWYSLSGGIIKIKGAHPGEMVRYNTYENYQIFYAPESRFVDAPQDTFGLQCAARDGKGGGDVSKHLRFVVVKDS